MHQLTRAAEWRSVCGLLSQILLAHLGTLPAAVSRDAAKAALGEACSLPGGHGTTRCGPLTRQLTMTANAAWPITMAHALPSNAAQLVRLLLLLQGSQPGGLCAAGVQQQQPPSAKPALGASSPALSTCCPAAQQVSLRSGWCRPALQRRGSCQGEGLVPVGHAAPASWSSPSRLGPRSKASAEAQPVSAACGAWRRTRPAGAARCIMYVCSCYSQQSLSCAMMPAFPGGHTT